MNTRRISVVLPVHNGANFIGPALDSILAQSHADFDLFVSENASTDATPQILADYARRDPRVKVFPTGELISQVANMNRAVALADTPWVKLFCHDDLMREDCLAQILTAIDRVGSTNVALIGNGERHLFENGYVTDPQADARPETIRGHDAIRRRFSARASCLPLPSVTTATVHKQAFENAGGFDSRYVHFDIFCWYELLTRHDFALVRSPLTINRIHGRQVAADARASLRSVSDYRLFFKDFLARHGDELGLGPWTKLRVRATPISIAATTLVIEIRSGRTHRVMNVLSRLPTGWLPFMVPAVIRAWRHERRRSARLAGKVPPALIYP